MLEAALKMYCLTANAQASHQDTGVVHTNKWLYDWNQNKREHAFSLKLFFPSYLVSPLSLEAFVFIGSGIYMVKNLFNWNI